MKINPGHECVRSMTECVYYGCQKLRCIIRIKICILILIVSLFQVKL